MNQNENSFILDNHWYKFCTKNLESGPTHNVKKEVDPKDVVKFSVVKGLNESL